MGVSFLLEVTSVTFSLSFPFLIHLALPTLTELLAFDRWACFQSSDCPRGGKEEGRKKKERKGEKEEGKSHR